MVKEMTAEDAQHRRYTNVSKEQSLVPEIKDISVKTIGKAEVAN